MYQFENYLEEIKKPSLQDKPHKTKIRGPVLGIQTGKYGNYGVAINTWRQSVLGLQTKPDQRWTTLLDVLRWVQYIAAGVIWLYSGAIVGVGDRN